MVTPAVKREAVAHLQALLDVSERRACRVIAADRTVIRYQSRRGDDDELREKLRELVHQRRRFGYRWIPPSFGPNLLPKHCDSVTLNKPQVHNWKGDKRWRNIQSEIRSVGILRQAESADIFRKSTKRNSSSKAGRIMQRKTNLSMRSKATRPITSRPIKKVH